MCATSHSHRQLIRWCLGWLGQSQFFILQVASHKSNACNFSLGSAVVNKVGTATSFETFLLLALTRNSNACLLQSWNPLLTPFSGPMDLVNQSLLQLGILATWNKLTPSCASIAAATPFYTKKFPLEQLEQIDGTSKYMSCCQQALPMA